MNRDAASRVVSMNDLARRTLPVAELHPFGQEIVAFHPPRSQPEVQFMLDQAATMPKALRTGAVSGASRVVVFATAWSK